MTVMILYINYVVITARDHATRCYCVQRRERLVKHYGDLNSTPAVHILLYNVFVLMHTYIYIYITMIKI